MSLHSEPVHVQEILLDDVTAIEIQAAHLSLIVEADPTLENRARLMAESGTGAPEMTLRGSRLRVSNNGRYRGASSPILKLPATEVPTIGVSISRGNLTIEHIDATLAINLDSGNLRIAGGDGDCAVNISSGNAEIRQREGDLACRIDSGNLELSQCGGDLAVNISKGNLAMIDCAGRLMASLDKGDTSLTRPVEQQVTIQGTKGDVDIQGGSLISANVDITRGDINSSARLLYTTPVELDDAPDDLDDFEDAVGDVPGDTGEEVRFNLGSVEFVASEAGVRVSTGGKERFVAGPEGLIVRDGRGSPIFVANEQGVKAGTSGRRQRDERFRFVTGRGSIHLDVADDPPARVELIVNRGDVRSDIPLVEVGRPGPRGATRRFVGVSDSSDTERILIRARTVRGDIQVRTHDATQVRPQADRQANHDRQRRTILEALATGKISTDEADILLAAMERDSG